MEQQSSLELSTIHNSLFPNLQEHCKELKKIISVPGLFVLVSTKDENRFGLENVKEFCVSNSIFDNMIYSFKRLEPDKFYEEKGFSCDSDINPGLVLSFDQFMEHNKSFEHPEKVDRAHRPARRMAELDQPKRPARPSAELNQTRSADGRAGSTTRPARPSAELDRTRDQLGGWPSWIEHATSTAIRRAGPNTRPVRPSVELDQSSSADGRAGTIVLSSSRPRSSSFGIRTNLLLFHLDRSHQNPGPQGKVGFPDFPPITEIDGEFRFPQQPVFCSRKSFDSFVFKENSFVLSFSKHKIATGYLFSSSHVRKESMENPGPQGKVGFPDFPPITEIDGEFRFPQQPNTFFDKQAEPWLRDSRFELDLLCSKYEELVPVLTVFFKNHVIMCLDTILVYNSYFDMHHQGTTGLVSKEKKKTPCLSARDLEMEVLEENDFKTGRKSFLKIIPSNHLSSTKSTHISLKSSDHPSKESGTIESPYQGFIKVLQYTTRHPFLNTATRTDNSTFLNS
ncbi:hypothetical protein F2Q68_00015089 [Brassica cretica]|uniref:Uncharacterized protein n=1 Tax=Brassica cretica TaxID=69181 RepID=A0A8S9HEP7_BRACR|nr:hypothetical protein F2Q68_00015089 [Brassica cretica]